MSSQAYLRHFITEDLYLVNEKEVPQGNNATDQTEDPVSDQKEVTNNSPASQAVALLVIAEIASDTQKELLAKVLSAVNHDLEKVPVVSPDTEHHYKAEKMLIFDNKHTNPYSLIQSNIDNSQILYSRSLTTLEQSIDDKKALWAALKNWFGV
jgi:DNA polymerase III psi subunit